MTSVNFLTTLYNLINSQDYRLSFSPAKKKNWMMMCNGHFIGGLFDEELYLVYTAKGSELLHHPEPVYRGYSSKALHKMLPIPMDLAKELLIATYKEKFDANTLVYDTTYTSIGAANIEDFYEENIVFLKFCFENKLLKKYPLDKKDRIIRMVYHNQDLTEKGIAIFSDLIDKFLIFCDRKGKTELSKMLKKWLIALEKEYLESNL